MSDLEETDRKLLEAVNRQVELIAGVVCVKGGANSGDDEEDRRRLKEKLKTALDLDKRKRVQTKLTNQEKWLEFIFGICKPDVRFGKRGSR